MLYSIEQISLGRTQKSINDELGFAESQMFKLKRLYNTSTQQYRDHALAGLPTEILNDKKAAAVDRAIFFPLIPQLIESIPRLVYLTNKNPHYLAMLTALSQGCTIFEFLESFGFKSTEISSSDVMFRHINSGLVKRFARGIHAPRNGEIIANAALFTHCLNTGTIWRDSTSLKSVFFTKLPNVLRIKRDAANDPYIFAIKTFFNRIDLYESVVSNRNTEETFKDTLLNTNINYIKTGKLPDLPLIINCIMRNIASLNTHSELANVILHEIYPVERFLKNLILYNREDEAIQKGTNIYASRYNEIIEIADLLTEEVAKLRANR